MNLKKKIAKANPDQLIESLTTEYSHIDLHINQTKEEQLLRIIEEKENAADRKSANSVFAEGIDVNRLIQETLFTHCESIQEWLDTARNYNSREYEITIPDEPVGTGMIYEQTTNLVKEYETNTIRVVIKKDPKMPMNFLVSTAYPKITGINITPTGERLDQIVRNTELYQNMDPIGKAYLEYRTHPNSKFSISYSKGYTTDTHEPMPSKSRITIEGPSQNPNLTHRICLQENRYFMYTTDRTNCNEYNRPLKTSDTEYVALRNKLCEENGYPASDDPNVYLMGRNNLEIKQMLYKECPELVKAADTVNKKARMLRDLDLPELPKQPRKNQHKNYGKRAEFVLKTESLMQTPETSQEKSM